MGTSTVTSVTLVANTEQQLIGPNSRRKSVAFFIGINATTYVRPDPLGNAAGGLPMAQFSPPVHLTYAEHGDIVRGPWFGFSSGAPVVGVLEAID